MIDLHAHVLPGFDDGPEDLTASLALLRCMQEQGIHTVVAGPHHLDGEYSTTRDQVLKAVEELNAQAKKAGLSIHVLPGMEVHLTFDLLRAAKDRSLVGINDSKYLLVELPHQEFPLYTERALFELMIAGYRPVINHPERNRGIQRKPDRMRRLAERGVLGAVTAASLLGKFGSTAKRLSEAFIQEEVATLVVSDAHNTVGRRPMLAEGLEAARTLGKQDQAAEAALLATA